jgi:mono/diheme cytochrome c family protein
MVALVMALALGFAVRYAYAADAKAGEAVYEAKCKGCHGATGVANPALAKALNVEMKSLGSADVQKLSDAQLGAISKNGKGKMRPVTLTDAEVSNVVAFQRTFKGKGK